MIKLLRFLKPYMGPVAAALVCLFLQAIAELYLPTLMSEIVDNGMLQGDSAYILKYGMYMLGVALASTVFAIAGSYLSSVIALGVGKDLRNSVFTRVESYSLNEFDKVGTSSLITRTTNDITQVQTLIVMGMRFMIYSPILCVGGLIMAWSKDAELTRVLFVIIPVMMGLMGLLASFVMPLYKSLQVKLDTVNRVLRENLTGIRVIRAFDRLVSENIRFSGANRDLTDVSIRVNKIMAAMQPIMMVLMNVTSIAIIWYGGRLISKNELALGDMMAFMQYAMQIMFSIIMVTVMFVMVPRAEASAERINQVLDLEPEIKDPEEAGTLTCKVGCVEFQNVSFCYPGAEEPALQGVTFSAIPGETTAIIGGTGSGKSTLINLIPRFYDVSGGTILVDGVDVRQMPQQTLRSLIGFVPQSPVLFSGTVGENIRYGREEATPEEVAHAAAVAQAEDFIQNLPEGYDAPVAQGGTNLSGGQKQRLSIARALVRKPEIYIFDDSFSALDFKTDSRLRAALKPETADSTMILVAQRVTTVMDADRIIVLDDGRVVGIGTHKQLMADCPIYREIVSSQLSEEEIA